MISLIPYDAQRTYPLAERMPVFLQVAKHTAEVLALSFDAQASVVYVSPQRIREINREERQLDAVTDVLSFPLVDWTGKHSTVVGVTPRDYHPQTGEVMLGDIIICPKRAQVQARRYGHSEEREACFLLVHGLLHLLGYDHEEEEETMFSIQEKILSAANIGRTSI